MLSLEQTTSTDNLAWPWKGFDCINYCEHSQLALLLQQLSPGDRDAYLYGGRSAFTKEMWG